MKEQSHLNYVDTVNFGSYYTPKHIVDLAYSLIKTHVNNISEYKFIDTSCGYGSFLQFPGSIGADYDKTAIIEAKNSIKSCIFFCHNSLSNISRTQYNLANEDKVIIIGNPPYNDTTSIIRNKIKSNICDKDNDVKHRDMGVSFLLSYDKLKADYICVLHPLSYLIKKANFEGLGTFKNNYVLLDAVVISSAEFCAASKTTHFPIIVALYKRCCQGMKYDDIVKYKFKTNDGKYFSINQFDKLNNYITKYPNHQYLSLNDSVAFFWTMRDINALKRTRTFIENEVYNSIRVPKSKLSLYCYADVFKEYISHIPYYFGNSDIMIDMENFKKIEKLFIHKSLNKYNFLRHLLTDKESIPECDNMVIDQYFKNLLGEHYVDKKIG